MPVNEKLSRDVRFVRFLYDDQVQVIKYIVNGFRFEVDSQWLRILVTQTQQSLLQDTGVLFDGEFGFVILQNLTHRIHPGGLKVTCGFTGSSSLSFWRLYSI